MKQLSNLTIFLTVFLFLSCFQLSVYAQPELELKKYRAKYPDESAIYLSKKEDVTIDIVNDKIIIYANTYKSKFFLDNKAGIYSETTIEYSDYFEIVDIKAKTLVPGKNKYKEIKVDKIITKDVLETDIFYNDIKSKNFIYPSLCKGAKAILSYTEHIKEPRFFGSFYFKTYIPIDHAEFNITCHEDVKLDFKLFSIDKSDIKFTKIFKKNKIIYNWIVKDAKKLKYESASPDIRYFTPHIIVYIKEYIINGKTKHLLSDLDDLYSWYYSLIEDLNTEDNIILAQLVDSLTKNINSEIEKVKSIYYWVQDNIKYIAIEKGIEGIVPRNAITVCENRYGDCKDMTSLTTKMLDMAGIKSHIAWIGTRDIPYSYSEMPTPNTDNHMIAVYKTDGKYYFLDATGNNAQFGYPTIHIQGKEALISLGRDQFEIVKVPEVDYTLNQLTDTVNIKLEGDKITGKGNTKYTGYNKKTMTNSLSDLTEKDKIKTLITYYGKGNNKFQIENLEVENIDNRDKDLLIRYSFNIQDYAKINEDEIYVNMHLDKVYIKETIEDDRVNDIEIRYKTQINYVVILEIPDGYHLDYIPENNSFKHELFGFDLSYIKTDNKIRQNFVVYLNHLLLTKKYFGDWNNMINKLKKLYSDVVILKKN